MEGEDLTQLLSNKNKIFYKSIPIFHNNVAMFNF